MLTEAQNPAVTPHRTAGPCALRGLRRADVADAAGAGARLAASVSPVLAAGKLRDHVADGDGACARRLIASGAAAVAARWQAAGEQTGAGIGFDTAVLTDAIGRQAEIENTPGLSLLDVTEPTETAVSAAFAHTAVLAGRPRNAGALAEAGRNFGRLAHLLDAVEDLPADRSAGAYNPLLATGTSQDRARQHCDEALADLRGAATALELEERALAESLLARGRRCRQPGLRRAGWRPGRAARVRWRAVHAGSQIPVQAAGLRTWPEAARPLRLLLGRPLRLLLGRPLRRLLLGRPLRRLLLGLLLRRVL